MWEVNCDYVAAYPGAGAHGRRGAGACAHTGDLGTDAPDVFYPALYGKRCGALEDRKRDILLFLSDALFFLAVAVIVMYAFGSAPHGGAPKVVLGYSCVMDLSPDMGGEIPKDSLLIIKQVKPEALKKGDAITFMRDYDSSVTHRIVGVYENFEKSRARGFLTQAACSDAPDKDVVYEANVVGKVIAVFPRAGAALAYLGGNISVVYIVFGAFAALSFCIRGFLTKLNRKKDTI